MRKGFGLLLTGAGLALGLAWLLKKKGFGHPLTVHTLHVTLQAKDGRCDIERQPPDIEVRRLDRIIWKIHYPDTAGGACNPEVTVCVARWTRKGQGVPPPFLDLEGGRFCRRVRKGGTKTIQAVVSPGAELGDYRYAVTIDDREALDPMVKVVI